MHQPSEGQRQRESLENHLILEMKKTDSWTAEELFITMIHLYVYFQHTVGKKSMLEESSPQKKSSSEAEYNKVSINPLSTETFT